MYDVKGPICMPDFFSNNIILHRFHVDTNEGESGIGYVIIFGHNLMVKLGPLAEFKRQVLLWYGATVPMK